MPVDYIINSKLTEEDIKAVNNVRKGWTLYDYARNAAVNRDLECQRLLEIYGEYENEFSFPVIADTYHKKNQRGASAAIRNSNYYIDTNFGDLVIETVQSMEDIVDKRYQQSKFVRAFKLVLRTCKTFDVDFFKSQCTKKKLNVYNNEVDIVNDIIEIYNKGLSRDNDKRISYP